MSRDFTSQLPEAHPVIAYLSDIFTKIICEDGQNLLLSENLCIKQGHLLMAKALSIALERYDKMLCANLPEGVVIHDKRKRTLGTKVGDVTFFYHRCRDRKGNSIVPVADALDIPWSTRISPAARKFLVDAGIEVSFTRASSLLVQAGGSQVSPTCVMNALRFAGRKCKQEDQARANSLYIDGVIPDADTEAEDICIESDGTWIRLQGADKEKTERIEIKALVSYAGKKTKGNKVLRENPVHHGCIASPSVFWTQGMAAVASRFNLSTIKKVHFGSDGEPLYKRGAEYLPINAENDTHLDPFHVNRAILACFPKEESKLAQNILGAAIEGNVEAAIALIEAARDAGLTNNSADRVISYLRNNQDIIYTGGPSLGTMEAEQQHTYSSRMEAVPCAWSIEGADAMARLRSRRSSLRKIPQLTRRDSLTPKRIARERQRELVWCASMIKPNPQETSGKGKEYAHVASLQGCSAQVLFAAGLDVGMKGIGW